MGLCAGRKVKKVMNPERVVVVDDDQSLTTVMGAYLRKQGYAAETYFDGQSVLAALRAGLAVSLLVTDLDMPGLDGFELLRAARQHDPNLQVIVVTGNGTVENAVRAMRADGAYDFLIKPFETLKVLSLAVERALAHRRLMLEREAMTHRLNTILTHAGDAILAADGDGRLYVANAAAARLLKREALVGSLAVDSLPKALVSLLVNWYAVGRTQPLVTELAVEKSDWLISLAPVPGRFPDDRHWVMMIRDITPLRRLDELKFQLLSETANKVRLPLAKAISNMAELNLLLGPRDRRAADLLYQQTATWERVKQWLDDMLTLVRIEAGIGLRIVEVDLNRALPEAIQAVADKLARERGLTLSVRLAEHMPPVRFDAELLRVLVQALLGHAAQRSNGSGEVELLAFTRNDQVWLEVSDRGPAIREADLPYLFDKSQANGEGPGVELALIKSIVDRVGGQVWLRNRSPVGSTLSLILPAVLRPRSTDPLSVAGAAAPGGR